MTSYFLVYISLHSWTDTNSLPVPNYNFFFIFCYTYEGIDVACSFDSRVFLIFVSIVLILEILFFEHFPNQIDLVAKLQWLVEMKANSIELHYVLVQPQEWYAV